MCFLRFNGESCIFVINNLNEFEFCKTLLKIREFCCESDEDSEKFKTVIENYDISKKEIRKILDNKNESADEFLEKLERSIKANKNKSLPSVARILEKHCKRESTENKDKQKEIKYEHVYNLLLDNKIDEICYNQNRIILFLDNAKAHKTEFALKIAEILNICFIKNPIYSPDLAPVEFVFKIIKDELKSNTLTTKEGVINKINEVFDEKCCETSIYQWFIDEFLTNII